MQTTYYIVLGIASFVAIVFVLLVFLTGKGDAMSGGGQVRTTFKGKASFDDQVSRLTIYLAGLFIGLMLLLDWLGAQVSRGGS